MVYKCVSLEEFKELTSKGLSIVDFTATWCQPCQSIGPFFDLFSKKYEAMFFFKVDIDELEEIRNMAGINAIPSFHVYKDGEVIDQLVGASSQKLEELITKHLFRGS